MNYTLSLFLQNGQSVAIPLWIAALGFASAILVPIITAYVAYRLAKPKTTVEIDSIKGKNREQDARGFEFQSQAFKDAQTFIDTLSADLNTAKRDGNNKQATIDILQMEKGKLLGQVELALKERDDVLQEVKDIEKRFETQLRDAIQKEQVECDKKIQALHTEFETKGNTFDRRISSLEQSNIADHNVVNVSEQIADEKVEAHKMEDHNHDE